MSWRATAFVAEITDNITRSEKLVLLCLSNRYNDDERCAWCSVPRLAEEALMSEKTVQRSLKTLVAKGFVSVGERPGQSSVYLITGLSDIGPTPDKMSGVSNWRYPRQNVAPPPTFRTATPDIAMSPHPRHSYVGGTVIEPSFLNRHLTVSEKKGSHANEVKSAQAEIFKRYRGER